VVERCCRQIQGLFFVGQPMGERGRVNHKEQRGAYGYVRYVRVRKEGEGFLTPKNPND